MAKLAKRAVAALALGLALVAVSGCGSGGSDSPAGIRDGVASDIDANLPVPTDAQKQPPRGAYRDDRSPPDLLQYYKKALADNGWSIEGNSSDLAGPDYSLTVCRQRVWNGVHLNRDARNPGKTLLIVVHLEMESDPCP
jgi:hypothetical protein